MSQNETEIQEIQFHTFCTFCEKSTLLTKKLKLMAYWPKSTMQYMYLFESSWIVNPQVNIKVKQKDIRHQRSDSAHSCTALSAVPKQLTGVNWQKWKRVFLTCPCHKIYRDEAVGLKSCKNTWKITLFVKMWNLGQYRENLIFCQ